MLGVWVPSLPDSNGMRPTAGSARRTASLEALFPTPIAVFPDPTHSGTETRFKAIGRTGDDRGVFVVFTLRTHAGETLIRPISARYMHAKEVRHYEAEAAKAEKR
jgi:uncharacterized protein